MEEIFEKEDAIGRLVREEGLLKTSSDFTARVMHLVNESPQRVKTAYKPLLSKGTWISIALGLLILTIISLFVVAPDKTTEMNYLDTLKPAFSFIKEIHFSFTVAPDTLMLATIIMASVALLLFIDHFLNSVKLEKE